MTMRENIAKAVFNEISKGQPGGKKYWETAPTEVKLFCYGITDAALEALSEPTKEMLWAGDESIDTCTKLDPCDKAAKHCWGDMISAARKI